MKPALNIDTGSFGIMVVSACNHCLKTGWHNHFRANSGVEMNSGSWVSSWWGNPVGAQRLRSKQWWDGHCSISRHELCVSYLLLTRFIALRWGSSCPTEIPPMKWCTCTSVWSYEKETQRTTQSWFSIDTVCLNTYCHHNDLEASRVKDTLNPTHMKYLSYRPKFSSVFALQFGSWPQTVWCL